MGVFYIVMEVWRMAYYGKDLRELKEQLEKKERIETELHNLQEKRKPIEEKVSELEKCKLAEEKDVARLEGSSVASFFYQVIGKKEEKLLKEKSEAYEAVKKYEVAREELVAIEQEIESKQEMLRKLSSCKSRYEQLFQEKLRQLRLAENKDILKLEESLYEIERQKREVEEALCEGRKVLSQVDSILHSLDKAQGWAKWDTFGGGGLVTDMAKHEHLQTAQDKIRNLQWGLQSFKTELADVEIYADIKVTIDDFLKFADYFFDGIFADWAVLDKISDSKSKITSTRYEIIAVNSKLENQIESLGQRYREKMGQIEQLVLKDS